MASSIIISLSYVHCRMKASPSDLQTTLSYESRFHFMSANFLFCHSFKPFPSRPRAHCEMDATQEVTMAFITILKQINEAANH